MAEDRFAPWSGGGKASVIDRLCDPAATNPMQAATAACQTTIVAKKPGPLTGGHRKLVVANCRISPATAPIRTIFAQLKKLRKVLSAIETAIAIKRLQTSPANNPDIASL